MKIEEIIHHLEPGADITVANSPFTLSGKVDIALEGGDIRYWLFDSEKNMLGISSEDEEIILFSHEEEELEPDAGMILFRNREYEFSYEDSGSVTKVEGELPLEEGDQTSFSDYESDSGEIVRIVTNQNSGEKTMYHGTTVVEEDILSLD
jgi:hypothetical protein